jgi:hypothetical protein
MVEFSQVTVGATGGDGAVFANGVGPVFEEFAVVEAEIQGVGRKAGGLQGGVPGGEELRDGVLRDFREGDPRRARWQRWNRE